MRLVLITKTHVGVYEGRKQLAVFEIGNLQLSPEDIEAIRTDVF